MDQATKESDSPTIVGLLAEFDGPESLVVAARGIREAGYTRFEAYSPFPVHGIDRAMGRRRTRLPWLVLAAGIGGGLGALLLQWWTNAVDYPFLVSGKPYFSLPANIPVAFELIILLSAFAAFGGALALSGLPQLFHPLLASSRFRGVTTDRFFIEVEATDPKFDQAATAELLRSLGASETEICRQVATRQALPSFILPTVVVLGLLMLLPPLWLAKFRYTRASQPRVHPVLDMDFQPKYLPQQASPLFADGRSMRRPVAGTIAFDETIDAPHLLLGERDGQPAKTFPMPVTAEMMQRGRERYDICCAICHGLAGDGDGITSQLAFEREEPLWVRPLSVHNQTVVEQPAGQLFKSISEGVRTMPSYASQIPVEDRWAIVLYVRALQRSRNATIEDVPQELREHLQ